MQGVGFRPFVKKLADRFRLPGIAFNTAGGLVVEIETAREDEARRFLSTLRSEAPVAARIERCAMETVTVEVGYDSFRILASADRDQSFTLISPDLATCMDCLAEIANPADRRFEYAFTNCTNCGPRYTITLSTPYDRANTTMRGFPLCADCAAEYGDIGDRRFHAEPVACPACGPRLSMEIREAVAALEAGQILAIKGLGGFQLACDAFCGEAVDSLRERKRRSRKPFAVMMRDQETVEQYCVVDYADRGALGSASAPIVLLRMRDRTAFPEGVAPGLDYLGVMLPYTPLHHLLFAGTLNCLVMTSGNISEEPIVIGNEEAAEKLSLLADRLLTHNRDIFMRVDDSVVRNFEGAPRVLRRARGFAPAAIPLSREMPEVLAAGAELKNTFCLTRGSYAILSQHIGDMENLETLEFFEETLRNLQSTYQATPRLIAHDLHPDYLSTRWAIGRSEPKLAVQHHHAHIASCMAENGVWERVIGVAFDGAGFGTDGRIWGGEFLVCDYRGLNDALICVMSRCRGETGRRSRDGAWRLHIYTMRLGQTTGLSTFHAGTRRPPPPGSCSTRSSLKAAMLTSSCGRLFDAVSAICGISGESSYEGESAMLLEAAAQCEGDEQYEVLLQTDTVPWTIDTRALIAQIARDISSGRSPRAVSRGFHNAMAVMIASVCDALRERNGLDKVCLSGGTFQNFTLLAQAVRLLRQRGFQVFLHSLVPPNDGGLSLGQAVIAANFLERI